MKKHIEKLKASLEKVKSQEVKMKTKLDFESAICGECYARVQGEEQQRFRKRCLGEKNLLLPGEKPAPDCVRAYQQYEIDVKSRCQSGQTQYCQCYGSNANLCNSACRSVLSGYWGGQSCPGCKSLLDRMYCKNDGIIKDCHSILSSSDCCGNVIPDYLR